MKQFIVIAACIAVASAAACTDPQVQPDRQTDRAVFFCVLRQFCIRIEYNIAQLHFTLKGSVSDPFHFDMDPDPRIRS